jgi:hypothetical protein
VGEGRRYTKYGFHWWRRRGGTQGTDFTGGIKGGTNGTDSIGGGGEEGHTVQIPLGGTEGHTVQILLVGEMRRDTGYIFHWEGERRGGTHGTDSTGVGGAGKRITLISAMLILWTQFPKSEF